MTSYIYTSPDMLNKFQNKEHLNSKLDYSPSPNLNPQFSDRFPQIIDTEPHIHNFS